MRIGWLPVVALALAGCAGSAPPAQQIPARSLTATLQPESDSGITGSANVNTVTGSTAAAVTIGGAKSGEVHPWHIHEGTCGSGGPIVGAPTAYPVLNVGMDGNASASARVGVGLDPNKSYYVNIHESPTNLGTIVACGELH